MSSKVFLLLFMYFFLSTLCLAQKTTVNTRAGSGQFTVIPIGFRQCEKPTKPYFKERMADVYMEMKNTIISGNITVYKTIRNSQASLQDLFYEEGRWQIISRVTMTMKPNCRTSIMFFLAKAFGIVLDKNTCSVGKGTYNFEVDYNKIEHIWTNTREYGRMLRRVEAHTKAATFVCYELETEVRPKTT